MQRSGVQGTRNTCSQIDRLAEGRRGWAIPDECSKCKRRQWACLETHDHQRSFRHCWPAPAQREEPGGILR